MTDTKIIYYCMRKKGASMYIPGDDNCVIEVVGKAFASVFILKGRRKLSLKCDAGFGQMLRNKYFGVIVSGYHCTPVQQPYNNTIDLENFTNHAEIIAMIDHSYMTIIEKLSKKKRREFEENN